MRLLEELVKLRPKQQALQLQQDLLESNYGDYLTIKLATVDWDVWNAEDLKLEHKPPDEGARLAYLLIIEDELDISREHPLVNGVQVAFSEYGARLGCRYRKYDLAGSAIRVGVTDALNFTLRYFRHQPTSTNRGFHNSLDMSDGAYVAGDAVFRVGRPVMVTGKYIQAGAHILARTDLHTRLYKVLGVREGDSGELKYQSFEQAAEAVGAKRLNIHHIADRNIRLACVNLLNKDETEIIIDRRQWVDADDKVTLTDLYEAVKL